MIDRTDDQYLQISIQPTRKKALEFDHVFVHYGEAVLRDMTLDAEGHYLYGATKSRVRPFILF